MKKIVFTDCTNKTYTIEEKDFRYNLKDENNNGFVTATNGTRISAMFIVQGLFNGRTKIVDKHMLLSTDTDQYTYEDYKEWCDECDVDCIYEEGSTEFYDWVHEQIDEDIHCDKINMQDSEYAERNFIMVNIASNLSLNTACVQPLTNASAEETFGISMCFSMMMRITSPFTPNITTARMCLKFTC